VQPVQPGLLVLLVLLALKVQLATPDPLVQLAQLVLLEPLGLLVQPVQQGLLGLLGLLVQLAQLVLLEPLGLLVQPVLQAQQVFSLHQARCIDGLVDKIRRFQYRPVIF
jgi:hypothetical protein